MATKTRKHINLMGVELEGGWYLRGNELPGFQSDGSVHVLRDRIEQDDESTLNAHRASVRSFEISNERCEHRIHVSFAALGITQQELEGNATLLLGDRAYAYRLNNNTQGQLVHVRREDCPACLERDGNIDYCRQQIATLEPRVRFSSPKTPIKPVREIGEVASPALTPEALAAWVIGYHPDKQNASCGTHIHVSFNNDKDYDRLATSQFYYWFLSATVSFFRTLDLPADVIEAWKNRLHGANQYCCPNYQPCIHGHGSDSRDSDCGHDCYGEDYDSSICWHANCEHDCWDERWVNRALAGRSSCLERSCGHDCEEDECGDDCQHECVNEMKYCFNRDCVHICDSDCYILRCGHNCQEGDCDTGYDSDDIGRGVHIPVIQRTQRDKNSPRYAHINYCEELHGTIEFRLFPHLGDAKTTKQVILFVADAIEEYLADPDNTAKNKMPVQPADNVVVIDTPVNDTWNMIEQPESNPVVDSFRLASGATNIIYAPWFSEAQITAMRLAALREQA